MTEQTKKSSQESPAGLGCVERTVLHALELASEDLQKWCGELTEEQLDARPGGLASVTLHLRHIAGSVDHLVRYAEKRPLSGEEI